MTFKNPFALSIGPQRSGTSWLDRYLRERGDVCVPEDVKEIFYFDRHYDRGFSFYQSHFKEKDDQNLTIEITTTSFDQKGAAERVFETFGNDINLICPLRHPVVRSYSLYLHYLRYGIVFGSLQEACEQNPQIIESSRYSKHLEKWFNAFGKDKISVLFQEDLENDQIKYVQDACKALNLEYIEPSEEISGRFNATTYSNSGFIARLAQNTADFLREHRLYVIVNVGKAMGLKKVIFGGDNPDAQKTTIPEEDRVWLEEQLGDEITQLESMIGEIPQWKN